MSNRLRSLSADLRRPYLQWDRNMQYLSRGLRCVPSYSADNTDTANTSDHIANNDTVNASDHIANNTIDIHNVDNDSINNNSTDTVNTSDHITNNFAIDNHSADNNSIGIINIFKSNIIF